MDTEVATQALVVAHVLEAVLVPNVQKVFFIVRSPRDEKKVERITRVTLANLEDLSDGRIGRGVQFYHVVISPKDAKLHNRVTRIIAKEVLAEAWRGSR